MSMPIAPGATAGEASMPLGLQAALYGALTSNPDLVLLRAGAAATAESVEVAKRFPTTLNPTLYADYRPFNFIPPETFGGGMRGAPTPAKRGFSLGKEYVYISWRQPIELKHQTTHRAAIAQAAYTLQQWTVVQAELTALVQTFRFYQTAAYRREKLRVAIELAEFNEKLVKDLEKRVVGKTALFVDVSLAQVERQATRQQVEAARVDYVNALTDLRNQLGIPETAGTAEPLGEFVLPAFIPQIDTQGLIDLALQSRPEIHAARARVDGAHAAVHLANADRTPSPVIGPEYESDEVSVQYIGMVFTAAIPILNNGAPLLRQRQAEYHAAVMALQQVEQRTVAQVKAAIVKWNQANELIKGTSGLSDALKSQVADIERLFEANQADVTKLFQARQRLIQLENAQLDATWQATQAQADLLLALGAPTLIAAARSQAESLDAAPAAPPLSNASPTAR